MQITLTYDRRRPYEIRRLARRYSESEILHYLDLHFSQAGTSKRDTVLLIPSGKGLGPESELTHPISAWGQARGIPVVAMPAPVNAIDALLHDQVPGGDIGVPIE